MNHAPLPVHPEITRKQKLELDHERLSQALGSKIVAAYEAYVADIDRIRTVLPHSGLVGASFDESTQTLTGPAVELAEPYTSLRYLNYEGTIPDYDTEINTIARSEVTVSIRKHTAEEPSAEPTYRFAVVRSNVAFDERPYTVDYNYREGHPIIRGTTDADGQLNYDRTAFGSSTELKNRELETALDVVNRAFPLSR